MIADYDMKQIKINAIKQRKKHNNKSLLKRFIFLKFFNNSTVAGENNPCLEATTSALNFNLSFASTKTDIQLET